MDFLHVLCAMSEMIKLATREQVCGVCLLGVKANSRSS